MAILGNRGKETTTTTGTGTYSLAGASAGFQTLVAASAAASGDAVGPWSVYYCCEDGVDWEIGIGTLTDASPDTLARTTIQESSNGGSAVNWAAGTRNIYICPTADALTNLTDGLLNSGNRLFYQQTAAPTGWTKVTDAAYNGAAIRIVTGSVSSGGTDAFTTVFGSGKATQGHTLTSADTPAHTHDSTARGFNSGGASTRLANGVSDRNLLGTIYDDVRTTTSYGSGGSHAHDLDLDLKYYDTILAQKD